MLVYQRVLLIGCSLDISGSPHPMFFWGQVGPARDEARLRLAASKDGWVLMGVFFFRFSHMQGGFNERIKKYCNKSNNTNNDHSNENNPKK